MGLPAHLMRVSSCFIYYTVWVSTIFTLGLATSTPGTSTTSRNCTGVSACLFVVATSRSVTYAVLVEFNEHHKEQYQNLMDRACTSFLHAVTEDRDAGLLPVEFGHAVDKTTFQLWQKLATSLSQRFDLDRESIPPNILPPAHDVVPYSVSLWNHVKGGQDVCSRILKNVKVDFRSLTPRGFIYIRLIMTALMNAHLCNWLLQMENRLVEEFST